MSMWPELPVAGVQGLCRVHLLQELLSDGDMSRLCLTVGSGAQGAQNQTETKLKRMASLESLDSATPEAVLNKTIHPSKALLLTKQLDIHLSLLPTAALLKAGPGYPACRITGSLRSQRQR